MRYYELLESASWKWLYGGGLNRRIATFNSGVYDYTVSAVKRHMFNLEVWYLEFKVSDPKHEGDPYGRTDKGRAVTVLRTVQDIFADFIRSNQDDLPLVIETNDVDKQALYAKILSRLGIQYHQGINPQDPSRHIFWIKRK